MKIVIGINSLSSSPYLAYSNHISLFHNLGRWAGKGDHEVYLYNPERMSIDRMRNSVAKIACDVGADYVLFIDDDVLVPLNFIDMMIEDNADIVAGDVLIRGYPFHHMSFIYDKEGGLNPIPDMAKEVKKQKKSVIDVGAVGFSLCLIKVELLKKLAQPYFVTGINNTEDIYFCIKAKEFKKNVTIKLDSRIQCGHILWHEVISASNKKDFTAYIEAQNPIAKPQLVAREKPNKDRGAAYLKGLKNAKKA